MYFNKKFLLSSLEQIMMKFERWLVMNLMDHSKIETTSINLSEKKLIFVLNIKRENSR